MSIERFYTTNFTIKRMTWSDESSFEATTGSFTGHIQQASQQLVRELDLQLAKAFRIWCATTVDIQEGDTVNDGTYDYSVKNIVERPVGNNTHFEIIVERDAED